MTADVLDTSYDYFNPNPSSLGIAVDNPHIDSTEVVLGNFEGGGLSTPTIFPFGLDATGNFLSLPGIVHRGVASARSESRNNSISSLSASSFIDSIVGDDEPLDPEFQAFLDEPRCIGRRLEQRAPRNLILQRLAGINIEDLPVPDDRDPQIWGIRLGRLHRQRAFA